MTLPDPLLAPAVRRVLDVEPAALGVVLSLLHADHELVVAARLALEVRAGRQALREAALDVHSALTPAEWRRWADNHVPHAELQRRRAQPGPTSPTASEPEAAA